VKTYATPQQQTFQLTVEEKEQARFKEQGRDTPHYVQHSNITITRWFKYDRD